MADVASAFRSWSVTAGSNSPTTATVVGAGLAPNLQQIQATVRQYLGSTGTSVVCSATTDLSTVDGFVIPLSGNSTVTSFGTEASGISYRLQFSGTPLIKNSTAIQCPVSADLQIAANDILTVTSQGSGNWKVTPELTATGKFSSIDTGTTGSLSLKTNNGTTQAVFSNGGTHSLKTQRTTSTNVVALSIDDNATGAQTVGKGALLQWTSNNAASLAQIGFEVGTDGTNNQSQLSFYTQASAGDGPRAGLQVIATIGSTRNITITGSNGGNPTISTTAGSLAITPAVTMASTLGIGGTAATLGTLNSIYGGVIAGRNSAGSGDHPWIGSTTINSKVDWIGVGTTGTGTTASGVIMVARIVAGAPTTSDIPSNHWALWRDSSGATTKIYYNNGGSLQSVALA